jgi:hypothetical protein
MSTAVITSRLELDSIAETALKAATRFWFVITIIGQLAFAFAVASFYGMTALRGNLNQWGRFITHGYAAGDTMGNLAVVMHVGSAVVIMLAGAVQLVPQIRSRFPVFHRWNGRIYMLTALTVSAAGVFMTWMRASVGDFWQHMGSSLNAVLIWVCAAMALRYAMARDFRTHRRWALRLFLVTSAAWFFRITFFLWLFLSSSSFGFDPSTLQTPFITFMSFGQYLLPLAVLEIYFRAQHRGALPRLAMAAAMFVISLGMVAGLLAVGSGFWVRQVKAAYDSRKSVAETLSATIASSGMASAEQQYRELKTGASAAYNFDEAELNSLGYQLLRAKKFDDAIRIFQLNVEAYPQSSNVYDSLGEGYMNAGNQAQAIANYEKSVQMNPKNQNGVTMLKKLRAR